MLLNILSKAVGTVAKVAAPVVKSVAKSTAVGAVVNTAVSAAKAVAGTVVSAVKPTVTTVAKAAGEIAKQPLGKLATQSLTATGAVTVINTASKAIAGTSSSSKSSPAAPAVFGGGVNKSLPMSVSPSNVAGRVSASSPAASSPAPQLAIGNAGAIIAAGGAGIAAGLIAGSVLSGNKQEVSNMATQENFYTKVDRMLGGVLPGGVPMGGVGGSQVVKTWSTGTASFQRTADGRIHTTTKEGIIKSWMPYHPKVFGKKIQVGKFISLAKKYKKTHAELSRIFKSMKVRRQH